jgi:hypothetical protein
MRLGDAEVGEQERDRLGAHRRFWRPVPFGVSMSEFGALKPPATRRWYAERVARLSQC